MKKAFLFLISLTVLTTSVFSVPRALVFDFGGVMTIGDDHSSNDIQSSG